MSNDWEIRVKYERGNCVKKLRHFKDRNEFIDWLHRQLQIKPITLIMIEEILD